MDVLIEKENGHKKRFSDLGIVATDFLITSAEVRSYESQITGRSGDIDKGEDYGPRSIRVPFYFISPDIEAYPEKRDEILAWLGGVKPFWIYEGRATKDSGEAGDILYKKRYFVRRQSSLEPDQQGKYGFDQIDFKTVGLPFGESPDIKKNVFTNPSLITIENAGTETIDPDEGMELVIEYTGAFNQLEIKNETNGSVWNCTSAGLESSAIKIKGVHSTLNGLSLVRNTNLGLVTLDPGINKLTVTGALGGTLSISFRQYYR